MINFKLKVDILAYHIKKNIFSITMAIYAGNVFSENFNMYEVYQQPFFPARNCFPGYQLLTADNARALQSWLVSRMGVWDVMALADGWTISGSGHKSQIQVGKVVPVQGWCTSTTPPLKPIIPNLPPISYPESSDAVFEWVLVNKESFFKPLSLLAHYFGYAWTSGNYVDKVGQGMIINRSLTKPGGYLIEGYNEGTCIGYRCKDRLSIEVDNFSYLIDSGKFNVGSITTSGKQRIASKSVFITNSSNTQQTSTVALSYIVLSNWSKTDSYAYGQKVTTKNKFQWPFVGETELAIEVSANQSWASLKGGSDSKTVTDTVSVSVPPHSKIEVYMETFVSNIEYPYTFDADVSYDVNFSGFMRFEGNALLSHDQNRPTINKKYTIGRASDSMTNLVYQYSNPGLGDTGDYWDWRWMIDRYSKAVIEDTLAQVTQPLKVKIKGVFTANTAYGSSIVYGPSTPLSTRSTRSTRSVEKGLSNAELEKHGIKNLEITVKRVP
ncbi:MAG: hypothetical protein RL571_3323 [Pseudomonadota bacterium]